MGDGVFILGADGGWSIGALAHGDGDAVPHFKT